MLNYSRFHALPPSRRSNYLQIPRSDRHNMGLLRLPGARGDLDWMGRGGLR
jgi:hypothetical protein